MAAANQRAPIDITCNCAPFANDLHESIAAIPVLPKERVSYRIEQAWCDHAGMFVAGWMHAFDQPIKQLVISTNLARYQISTFSPRPDVASAMPEYAGALNSGFGVYLPWQAGSKIRFEVTTPDGSYEENILIPRPPENQTPAAPFCLTDGTETHPEPPATDGPDPLTAFINLVNRPRLRIAEVGARAVSENAFTLRSVVPSDSRYLGVDIHPGPNVDIVGDAHRLHELVGENTLDATFSFSVMEHLAHPWVYAHSVNRALRIGGIAFQSTHQTCGLHEQPNDFWRFSDHGLRVLFGPDMGFEVIKAGMRHRTRIHPAHLRREEALSPLVPSWSQAFILVRKVAHLDAGAVSWPVGSTRSKLLAELYPEGSSLDRFRTGGSAW